MKVRVAVSNVCEQTHCAERGACKRGTGEWGGPRAASASARPCRFASAAPDREETPRRAAQFPFPAPRRPGGARPPWHTQSAPACLAALLTLSRAERPRRAGGARLQRQLLGARRHARGRAGVAQAQAGHHRAGVHRPRSAPRACACSPRGGGVEACGTRSAGHIAFCPPLARALAAKGLQPSARRVGAGRRGAAECMHGVNALMLTRRAPADRPESAVDTRAARLP